MEKILLDTDIGGDIDDAICLAYLLQEPACQLLGISTVCGESEKRAAVADALCTAAGKNIPIVAGMDTALQPIPLYPTPEGAGALARWPHRAYQKGDAPAFLYQKIRENPHEVILVGIGNLTNIAVLFQTYPDAPGLLKGLYLMNGYFGAAPLPEAWYNWNSWADPLASKIVFATPADTFRVMPLEVTETLTLGAGEAGKLLQGGSRLIKAVLDFGGAWLESSEKLTLHDPLAAMAIFYPALCSYERGRVSVETKAGQSMGGTAFSPSPNGHVEVARSVDRGLFYKVLGASFSNSF